MRSSFSGFFPSSDHYDLLPIDDFPTRRSPCFISPVILRRTLLFLACLSAFIVLAILCSGVPPSYRDIRAFERSLPQHNLSFAESHHTLYIRFPDHLWGHGLNNVLQEAILLSFLASRTNRSFVFEDYVWSRLPVPYTLYDFALRPVRIPLNAFISGPIAGSAPTLTSYPPAISAEFWDSVCPPEKQRVISAHNSPGSGASGAEIITYWQQTLNNVQDQCVSIDLSSKRIFDFESDNIISLWPDLSRHPILADFQWSPLVLSSVLRNFAILPHVHSARFLTASNTTLPGLVAVHLRRGDYKRHCPRLATWHSGYNGLNAFRDLPDQFDPAAPLGPTAYRAYYMQHCLPTVEQITEKLRRVRVQFPQLKAVYLLTNGWGWWLAQLQTALRRDGWEDVRSSLDLELDKAQTYVAMAVDMAIAERAEVFVGNGFSSLSSNIVMLRMARGLHVSSNRFF